MGIKLDIKHDFLTFFQIYFTSAICIHPDLYLDGHFTIGSMIFFLPSMVILSGYDLTHANHVTVNTLMIMLDLGKI